jgi:hypothetical protein
MLLVALWVTFGDCEDLSQKSRNISLAFNYEETQDSGSGGAAFATSIEQLDLITRERMIYKEIARGKLPSFLRNLIPIKTSMTIQEHNYAVTFYVMPDYLEIGTDQDHFLMPMTPILAQRVMDLLGGILPTRKMVNLIWEQASVKLEPAPIPPSSKMATVPIFIQHNELVLTQRKASLSKHPQGELTAGHKKDVILSNRIHENPDRVMIYGWHYLDGVPIQPLYSGHINWYADYSHGIRAVLAQCVVNDSIWNVADIISNPRLYPLLSDESSPMETTRYDTSCSNYP